ncbi:MAG TPA: S-layer homology domain-containing protein, partial [Bryobacteraceae bacterium]|nr:S-layer homology domain-containing protein [Bryobacteraceae bacterium]
YSPRLSERRPGLIDPLCGTASGPAVASSSCDSQAGREWEGISATDYFTYEPNVFSPPNPDIAVGPDDILTVVNRTIARYPNPNAPSATNNGGTAPVTYDAANTYFFSPTNRQFLDVWLGEAALNELCPTFPRSNISCVIENASVRYDQMQGRFLVLFTVADTGLVNCSGCIGVPTQTTSPLRRKASWVLVSSRWATGCAASSITVTGVNIGSACVPNTTPATPGISGNTLFFTTPQPPGPSQSTPNSGGINSNWVVSYGAPDNSCESGCPYGNINSISDLRRGGVVTGARIIDCNNTAVGDTARVCYFPSSARLGLDNDNIVITSSVYNDNLPLATRGITSGANGLAPAWEGTRVRVYKKTAVYSGLTSMTGVTGNCGTTTWLCPGASQSTPQLQGDFYDLWAAGTGTTPFTTDITVARVLPAGATVSLRGLHYEPEHVRGRSLASFNGNANLDGQFSSIWGAIDQSSTDANPPQTLLYHRPIVYTRTTAGTIGTNVLSTPAIVNIPSIVGGIPTLGALQSHTVPQFTNPNSVVQRAKLVQPSPNNQLPTPYLYVGDDRPHRVISREGHRYIARVGATAGFSSFSGGAMDSTVIYDIVQKLTPAGTALEIYNTNWGNGSFYAPMFDTPANVVQYGSISPINVLPFLEKLFVGTAYPPLAPSDPRTFSYGNIVGQALLACKGQDPSISSGASRAYPGLFDIRCGEDAYDTAQAYRHPITGAFTPSDFQVQAQPSGYPDQIVPFGIRGGAATDPNNLGLWLYGAYAKGRLSSINGFGVWGTYVAHYPLTFPLRDPYNNSVSSYSDVPAGHPFFTYIQIAKQTEIDPGSRTASSFNVNGSVTRAEMARWTIRGQMNEAAVTAYINSTGGFFCSFADVCPGTAPGANITDSNPSGDWRYVELMYRRGYTKGCEATNDGQRRFCPTRNLTRGEMSVFLIRAKMNSVFPTVTSGAFTTTSCQPPGTQVVNVGDQYGLFTGCSPYFSDVPNTHIFYSFIQKMRELRISNGTTHSTGTALGTYSPDQTLTRGELMVFLIRAFFP